MKQIMATLLVGLLLAPVMLRAQGVGSSGDIRGTIKDPSGAVLPGVSVTVSEPAMRFTRTVTSSAGGQCQVTGLPPATCDVTAKARGFATEIRKSVVVALG